MILTIIFLLAAVMFGTIVHIVGYLFVAFIAGVRVKEVQLTYGKPLVRFRLGVIPVVVGWLPWGGSVSLDVEQLQKIPAISRCFLHLSGIVAVFLFSAICLRYDQAVTEFVIGFSQIINGALSPLTEGQHLVRQLFQLIQSAPMAISAGVITSKIAVFNALPIPPNPGGMAILSLILGSKRFRVIVILQMVGVFVLLTIIGSWIVAICAYLLTISNTFFEWDMMKILIAYVLIVPLANLCLTICVWLVGFPVSLCLAWAPMSLRVKVAGFCGGIAGIALSVALGYGIFRFVVGPESFTIGPFLASTLPLLIGISNDIKYARVVKFTHDKLCHAFDASIEDTEMREITGYPIATRVSCIVGYITGLCLAFAWFLLR